MAEGMHGYEVRNKCMWWPYGEDGSENPGINGDDEPDSSKHVCGHLERLEEIPWQHPVHHAYNESRREQVFQCQAVGNRQAWFEVDVPMSPENYSAPGRWGWSQRTPCVRAKPKQTLRCACTQKPVELQWS